MKLTLKVKLIPSEEQHRILLETLKEANAACNQISDIAWRNRTFNQFKLHHLCYNDIRNTFNLSAQIVVRCISKVADAYKLDRKRQRVYRDESVTMDFSGPCATESELEELLGLFGIDTDDIV